MEFEALGCPANSRVLAQQRLYLFQCVAEPVAGYGNENVAHAIETTREIRVGAQVRGKADTRKVPFVLAVRNHGLEKVELDDTAEPDVTTSTRKLQRQRSSPGTRADDRYRCWCRVDDLV